MNMASETSWKLQWRMHTQNKSSNSYVTCFLSSDYSILNVSITKIANSYFINDRFIPVTTKVVSICSLCSLKLFRHFLFFVIKHEPFLIAQFQLIYYQDQAWSSTISIIIPLFWTLGNLSFPIDRLPERCNAITIRPVERNIKSMKILNY